jgi:hypothetical protein
MYRHVPRKSTHGLQFAPRRPVTELQLADSVESDVMSHGPASQPANEFPKQLERSFDASDVVDDTDDSEQPPE